jgi:hypothetical protein
LVEYFTCVKRGLRSLLVCGKISDTALFTPNKVSQKGSLVEICSLLPTFSHILQSDNFCQEKITDFQLRNLLKNITVLGVAYDDLSYHVAKGMTIARRSELMQINQLTNEHISLIGAQLYQALSASGYTDHQILGILDCKYAEASFIKNMADKIWTYNGSQKVRISKKNCLTFLDWCGCQ